VAAGSLIAYLSGVTIGATLDVDCWAGVSIHVKTVDSGATIVVRISGHIR